MSPEWVMHAATEVVCRAILDQWTDDIDTNRELVEHCLAMAMVRLTEL